ncbi:MULTISPECIES: sulfite exporter TauE/SafE family protein [Alteromonadaceae]|uniref:sulfite exporter TauE/SafE family protein n=1 Tax=Alteromonadaceae TaxID=72275 RepID=UPI00319E852B
MLHVITANQIRCFLFVTWFGVLLFQAEPLLLITEYSAFAILGVVGAIFANATGAGGGVIFVPFFNQLGFDSNSTVATSFAIQCCGMTAGAITWWAFYRKQHIDDKHWHEISKILKLTVPFSVLGIWLAQLFQAARGGIGEAEQLHAGFGVFSIGLAIALFASIPLLKKQSFSSDLARFDCYALTIIAFIGGIITAYLSIGVGELVAIYLIIRKFSITFSIALAVILSAFSVWSAIIYHGFFSVDVYWPVVLFAGAGAIIGGILAKQVVLYFSATNLKIFFASWVLFLGFSALPY